MISTRPTSRPVCALLAAGHVAGEYLHNQRVEQLDGNRWQDVKLEGEMSAGDSRTPFSA
jgi:hypothetical protein